MKDLYCAECFLGKKGAPAGVKTEATFIINGQAVCEEHVWDILPRQDNSTFIYRIFSEGSTA